MNEYNMHYFFIEFGRIVTLTMLLPIIVAFFQRNYLNKPLKNFTFYRLLAFLFNVLEHVFYNFAVKYYKLIEPYFVYWKISDTSFLSILYHLNNFAFLSWFYFLLLPHKYGKLILWLGIFLFASSSINYLFIEGYRTLGIFNPTATALFTFGVAGFYLWYTYKTYLALPITKNPYFWLSIGLMLPYVVSFFLYLVEDIMQVDNYELFVTLSIVKNCFLIIGQFLMAIGFWRARYAQYIPLPEEKVTTV